MLNLTYNLVLFCPLLKSHAGIEAERLRVNASVRTLQQQLEDCRDESSHWMEQFHSTRDELRSTKQEWVKAQAQIVRRVSVCDSFIKHGHHHHRISMVSLCTSISTNVFLFFFLPYWFCFLLLPILSESHAATLKHSEGHEFHCISVSTCGNLDLANCANSFLTIVSRLSTHNLINWRFLLLIMGSMTQYQQ